MSSRRNAIYFEDVEKEVLTLLEEDNDGSIDITVELENLVKEGIVLKSDGTSDDDTLAETYRLNEHYHIEWKDIPVLCMNSSCSKTLNQFPNAIEAGKELGISVSSILKVCRRLTEKWGNLCFRWADENISEYLEIEEQMTVSDIKSQYIHDSAELEAEGATGSFSTVSEAYSSQKQYGEYTILRKRRYPDELQQYIGRRFSRSNEDDVLEVFTVTHVCQRSLSGAEEFYFRFYSNSAHPVKRPTEDNDFQYMPVDRLTSDDSEVNWVPAGVHALTLSEGNQSGGRWRSVRFGQQRQSTFSDESDGGSCNQHTSQKGSRHEILSAAKERIFSIVQVRNVVYDLF